MSDAKQNNNSGLGFDFTSPSGISQDRAIIGAPMPQIFGDIDLHTLLIKLTKISKEQSKFAQPTNQKFANGITSSFGVPQPVNIAVARSMKDISPHHASCIRSKLNAIMGLGFVSEGDEVQSAQTDPNASVEQIQQTAASLLSGEAFVESKVDEILNPMTLDGFMYDLYRAIEDYLDGGTGYLEVLRDQSTKAIVGINWIPYECLRAVILMDISGRGRLVYKYTPLTGVGGTLGGQRWFSPFGINNRKWVYEHFYSNSNVPIDAVSEIIAFKSPSNMARWYGYPDWLSASTIVTLVGLALQYKSDFYTNRGVLAYILSIMGDIDGDKWKQIEQLVQGSVGGGNNFRNLAIQLKNSESSVQLDKLASSDKTEMQFAKDMEVYSQLIVSAHRVPPVLANILIPGKLGAANETIQALIAFQLLNIGPHQTVIQSVLARTLGSDSDGVSKLKSEDFRFRKITSQFDIVGLNTVGGMREEAVGSKGKDGKPRDVSEGMKK